MLTRREIEDYQRINASDRSAFNCWLRVQVIIGSASVAVMALTIVFGAPTNLTIVSKDQPIHRAEAR